MGFKKSSKRRAEKCPMHLAMQRSLLEAGTRPGEQKVRTWRQHCGGTVLQKGTEKERDSQRECGIARGNIFKCKRY